MDPRQGGRMRITIAAADDVQATLRLYRWLRDDENLAADSSVEMLDADDTPQGTMGAAEIIELVLTQGMALANLAIAYATWRQSCDDDETEVTFSVDGGSITVKDGSPETIDRIIAQLSPSPNSEAEGQ
ncbi:hypothetical protein ACIA5C_46465 [Actinoplanes sp. NPDC051343]|uniref:effector-associated constant component EACC1 n=1 Tax=Actinoplanes sp. NPDC051343 TaxID=3363906 RepID=UPI0037AAB066